VAVQHARCKIEKKKTKKITKICLNLLNKFYYMAVTDYFSHSCGHLQVDDHNNSNKMAMFGKQSTVKKHKLFD